MHNQTNTNERLLSALAAKRALLGTGIGLVLISIFLLSAGEGNPAWPRFWMVRPLLVVPLAGAVGGLFYHIMDPLRRLGVSGKIWAAALSLLAYLVILWLGTVLGLDGTWWD